MSNSDVATVAARMIRESYAAGDVTVGTAEEATKQLFKGVTGNAAVYHGKPSKEIKYWKRRSDGFIVTGPTVVSDPYDYQRFIAVKRCRELDNKYGREQVGGFLTGTTTRYYLWYINGGLTAVDETGEYGPVGEFLMPPQQVVQLLWHRNPEVRKLRADVVAGAVDVECPHGCSGEDGNIRLFWGWGKEEAERSLRQHINASHEKQQAAESIGRQNRDMMEGMATLFAEKLASNGQQQLDMNQIVQMMAAAMAAAQLQPQMVDANKYPQGTPDDTWKRQELMAYAKDHSIPQPENPMKLKTADWLSHVLIFA